MFLFKHDNIDNDSAAASSSSDAQNKSPQPFSNNEASTDDLNMESRDNSSLELQDNHLFSNDKDDNMNMDNNFKPESSLDEQLGLKIEDDHPQLNVKLEDPPKSPNMLNDDKELVGLFEDSDDEDNAEEPKSKSSPYLTSQDTSQLSIDQDKFSSQLYKQLDVFEETEIINTTLNAVPKPLDNENLAICRFPPTLTVLRQNDVRNFLRANPHLLEQPPSSNTLSMLCFRHSNSSQDPYNRNNFHSMNPNSGLTSEHPDNGWESNGKLVVWDDGSLSMFVGRVPLDCEAVNEISFLLEDGRSDIKPVHAQVMMRLQTRFSNLHTRFSNLKSDTIKKQTHKRQKMEVASLSDAIQSHHALQQNLLNIRENDRHKKVHYGSKGLTRSFLESSDNEDDLLM